jgi:peptidoglycan/xylan/chitin deacetylase (PgdA/CDA1 family)
MQTTFERGTVILSIDTEQIWGYLDLLNEAQFEEKYPNAPLVHEKLLDRLSAAGVGATWFVVGGMALRESIGAGDPRMIGLPPDWIRTIAGGSEQTAPLWFRRSFVERLRDAQPAQEIGLHGGLTHLIWTDPRARQDGVKRELSEGINALRQVGVKPRSFSFTRNEEAYHELLADQGIRCFRGCPPALAWRLGRTFSGALWRAADEVRCATPPPVWPRRRSPDLWSIPASMFLYPLGPKRARILSLGSRVERFRKGLNAARRSRGIFHFGFHPENLAESPQGFTILDDILAVLTRAREQGDIELMTMSDVVDRMEKDEDLCISTTTALIQKRTCN